MTWPLVQLLSGIYLGQNLELNLLSIPDIFILHTLVGKAPGSILDLQTSYIQFEKAVLIKKTYSLQEFLHQKPIPMHQLVFWHNCKML